MSPRQPRGYRPPRDRREVVVAVLGVLAVVLFTVGMLWVLAPEDDTPPPVTPPVTLPADPSSTLPTDPTATTLPAVPGDTTPTSAPG